jgi:hypothetical protein
MESGMLDQARLQELLDYNSDEGTFVWRRAAGPTLAGRRAGRQKATHLQIAIDHKIYQGARLAWLYVHGSWPTTLLRFNDGNPGNIRIANLRLSIPNSDRLKDAETRRAYKADLRERAGKLTAEILRALLDYDPLTGVFTWREAGSGRISGQPAGTLWATGYRTIHIFGRDYQAQRLAWLHAYGEWPIGKVIFDNCDPKDCRLANLRMKRTKQEGDAIFRARHPGIHREYNLHRYQGMTIDAFNAMLAEQGGVCAICGQPETATRNGKVRWLCVDHDHKTGDVRGLLCVGCNTAIGYAQDDPTRLEAAAAYLLNRTARLVQMKRSA